MQCTNCQIEVSERASFCVNCGAALGIKCSGCQTVSPTRTNFCVSCGLSLNARWSAEQPESGDSLSAPAVSSWTTSSCLRCNAINEHDSDYCYQCGLALNDPSIKATSLSLAEIRSLAGEPAGFWIRLVAVVIDTVVLIIMAIPLLYFTDLNINESEVSFEFFTPSDAPSFILGLLYFTAVVALWSTTLGKRIFGLYILRPDGSRVGPGRALLRSLAQYISAIYLFIGFIMIGVRQDKRGLHDLICDTVVVKH